MWRLIFPKVSDPPILKIFPYTELFSISVYDAFAMKLRGATDIDFPLLEVEWMSLDFSFEDSPAAITDKDFTHVFNITCDFDCHIEMFSVLEDSRFDDN